MTHRPASVLYDGKGRIIRLSQDTLDGASPQRGALGNIEFGHRRLNYSERFATADPASRLSSPIVDLGSGAGISFPLNGGWGSVDWAGGYPNIIWSLEDLFGSPLGSLATPFLLTVFLRTPLPVVTDEFRVFFAIVNDSVLTGATVDGTGVGVIGTGVVAFAGLAGRVINGTCADTASTTDASIVGATSAVVNTGIGSAAVVTSNGGTAIDSVGTRVTNIGVASSSATAFGNPSRMYLALTAGRNSAGAAGGVTVNVDAYVSPILRSPHPVAAM